MEKNKLTNQNKYDTLEIKGVTKLSWGFPNFNGVCPWGLI